MSRIVWSRQALEDLEAIGEFIARDSARYAATMVERLTSATERLQRFPQSGRVVPEVGDPELREVLVGSYRVIYRVRGEGIGIVTVLHGARQLQLPPGAA